MNVNGADYDVWSIKHQQLKRRNGVLVGVGSSSARSPFMLGVSWENFPSNTKTLWGKSTEVCSFGQTKMGIF